MVNPIVQSAYISVELYPNRMFPTGCALNGIYFIVKIMNGNTQLAYSYASGTGTLLVNSTSTKLAAGTISVSITATGTATANEIPDYTLKIYSEKGGVVIKDASGN